MFDIEGKVAMITGGAAGIGLQCAKELLRNGLKACCLADINEQSGNLAKEEITKEFGQNRVLFVKTDVTDKSQFEDAFKATVSKFNHIDILINNAGIINDFTWEREIHINLNGTIHGCLLGCQEYFSKYKSGNEAVIINLSSIAGLDPFGSFPIYTAIKHAIVGLSRSLAAEMNYRKTNVKILTICPGLTKTSMLDVETFEQRCLTSAHVPLFFYETTNLRQQSTTFVAQCMIDIIKKGENGSVWLVEHKETPSEVNFISRHERKHIVS